MQGVLRTQKINNTASGKAVTVGWQNGSVLTRYGSTAYYKVFPQAFAAAPGAIQLTPMTGTVLFFKAKNIKAGSFNVLGSPVAKYLMYSAYGSLTV